MLKRLQYKLERNPKNRIAISIVIFVLVAIGVFLLIFFLIRPFDGNASHNVGKGRGQSLDHYKNPISIPELQELYEFSFETNIMDDKTNKEKLDSINIFKSNVDLFYSKETVLYVRTLEFLDFVFSFVPENGLGTRYRSLLGVDKEEDFKINRHVMEIIAITDLVLIFYDYISLFENNNGNTKFISSQLFDKQAHSIFTIGASLPTLCHFFGMKSVLYSQLKIEIDNAFNRFLKSEIEETKISDRLNKMIFNFKQITNSLSMNSNIFLQNDIKTQVLVISDTKGNKNTMEFDYYKIEKIEDIKELKRMFLSYFFIELFVVFDISLTTDKNNENSISVEFSKLFADIIKVTEPDLLKELKNMSKETGNKTKQESEVLKEYYDTFKSNFVDLLKILENVEISEFDIEKVFLRLESCLFMIGAHISNYEKLRKRALMRINNMS